MNAAALTMYFTQYGGIAIFVIVFLEYLNLPGFPAGVMQMPLYSYIVSSTLGIAVWNLVFVGAGYLMGDQIFRIFRIFQ